MPKFKFAFLIRHARELMPQLDFSGSTLANLEVGAGDARAALEEELAPFTIAQLEVNGFIPTVLVEVDAEDEDAGLLAGFHQAAITLEPYSLLVPEREMMDFSRSRPTLMPHALLINDSADPPNVAFRYQGGPSLLRITVGAGFGDPVKKFNNDVVRQIAADYPPELLRSGHERAPLALRIGRAMHWYAQAEGQTQPTMAFVCYWIGVEALVLKSSTSSNKKKTLVKRLADLVRLHDVGADWTKALNDLWDKRSDIVHEGYGATLGSPLPDVDAGDVNQVRYLFAIALLYAVGQHKRSVPLEDLWHPKYRDDYRPTVLMSWEHFPGLMQTIEFRRRRVPADK